MPTGSVCAPDVPTLYDLSSRGRMVKISVTQVPNPDPVLAHAYKTSRANGQIMHPSDHPTGGGEPSPQAFRTSRMLIEMPYFIFEFRYSGGKTPLITVAMLGMLACHCVSDLAPSKMDMEMQRPTSKPCWYIEDVNSWLSWSNRQTLMRGFAIIRTYCAYSDIEQ